MHTLQVDLSYTLQFETKDGDFIRCNMLQTNLVASVCCFKFDRVSKCKQLTSMINMHGLLLGFAVLTSVTDFFQKPRLYLKNVTDFFKKPDFLYCQNFKFLGGSEIKPDLIT